MNKKKILVLAMTLSMVAILAMGATLAYFTDTDEETNVFTMGGVSIDLIEQQFNEQGALEDFEDDKNLMPGVANKQDKIVTIKNDGDSPAYVWYEWYIPTALDSIDGSTGLNNVLHVNSYGATWDNYYGGSYTLPAVFTAPANANQTWDHDPEIELGLSGTQGYVAPSVEIDGIEYNKYTVLYKDVLAVNATTPPAMNGVYLDADLNASVVEGETVYTCFGEEIDFDFEEGINIIVKAYGIQSEGFDTVYDAWKAYQDQ